MRVLNFAKNIFFSNISRLNHPYKLTFALTYKCNSRCKICSIWKRKNHSELSLEEIASFFSKNTFFNWIDITGGEVFLRRDLLSIIKIILETQRNLYLLHIPTNGIMTNIIVNDIKSILALKPSQLIISIALDGPPEIHDRLRGILNNWQYAVKTFKELRRMEARNFKVYFGMTLSYYNYSYINKTCDVLQGEILGFDHKSVHFNIAHNSDCYYNNGKINLMVDEKVAMALSTFNKNRKIMFSPISWLETVYQDNVQRYIKNHKCPLPCKALSSSLFIDPDGNIYPCTMWNNLLGNIKNFNYSISDFWKRKEVINVLRKINDGRCVQCWTPCEAYQSILGNLLNIDLFSKIF